jgi:hypothetical protein
MSYKQHWVASQNIPKSKTSPIQTLFQSIGFEPDFTDTAQFKFLAHQEWEQ